MRASKKTFIVALLFVGLLQTPTMAKSQGVKSEYYIRDTFSYECTYDLLRGYLENLTNHIVEIEFRNLIPSVHNITTVLSTRENLKFVNFLGSTLSPPANCSKNGEISVTVLTDAADWCELRIGLNQTQAFMDPINFGDFPSGQDMHILEKDGHVTLAFWLNTSEPLENCMFSLSSRDGADLRSLDVCADLKVSDISHYSDRATFLLSDVSKGNHQIFINALISGMWGAFDIEVAASREGSFIPIACYLDNDEVVASVSTTASYSLSDWKFCLIESPFYYYMNSEAYCLNFTAPQEFTLRLGTSSRERADYLILDALPQNFSVIQTEYSDEPCYQFTFKGMNASKCCLGLQLKDEGWFVSPATVESSDTPAEVKTRYLDDFSSSDGQPLDAGDPFVQQYARQVVADNTNPYAVALSIFRNITETLSYPENWTMLEEEHQLNESVSQVLRYRYGVCRHFAMAYVALCICSGLPARTVKGTAMYSLNETWKKNHEWAEVYLSTYGWVTVDPAWHEFCLLSAQHARSTWWTYLNGTLNVTYPEDAFRTKAKIATNTLITSLVKSCEALRKSGSLKAEQAELHLNKATVLASNGLVHEALLEIALAYLLTVNDSPERPPSWNEFGIVVLAGIGILGVAFAFKFRKVDHTLLMKEEDLETFSPFDVEGRKIEYDLLNKLVTTRENSTLVVGSIISSISFLALMEAFKLESISRFMVVIGAILLEGSLLCYYQATVQIDDVCYDLIRKLEKRLFINVHTYLKAIRDQCLVVRIRGYLWFVTFLVFWIIGLVALFPS